MNMKNKKGQG